MIHDQYYIGIVLVFFASGWAYACEPASTFCHNLNKTGVPFFPVNGSSDCSKVGYKISSTLADGKYSTLINTSIAENLGSGASRSEDF
ncbi:MAG: hypothetical protein ACXV74_13510 [Methylobacter sp.]